MAGSEAKGRYSSQSGRRRKKASHRSFRSALVGAAVIVWLCLIVGCDRKTEAFCPSKFIQKHDVAGFVAAFLAQEHITKPPSIERGSFPPEALVEDQDKDWLFVDISAEMEGGVEQASRLTGAYFEFVEKDLYAKRDEESHARERAGKPATGRHDGYVMCRGGGTQFFLRYGIGDNVGIFFSEVTTIDQGRIRLKVVIYEERFD